MEEWTVIILLEPEEKLKSWKLETLIAHNFKNRAHIVNHDDDILNKLQCSQIMKSEIFKSQFSRTTKDCEFKDFTMPHFDTQILII